MNYDIIGHRPGGEMKAALEALERLAAYVGPDAAERVACQFIHHLRLRLFRPYLRLHSRPCIARLSKKSHLPYRCPACLPSSLREHIGTFVHEDWSKSVISQPYCLTFEELQEIVEFCKANNVRCEINADDSWHFPGRTLAVVFTQANHCVTKAAADPPVHMVSMLRTAINEDNEG